MNKMRTILCYAVVLVFGGLGAFSRTTEGVGAGGYGDRPLVSSVNDDGGDVVDAGSVPIDHHRERLDEAVLEGPDSVEVVVGWQQRRLLAPFWGPGYSDLVFESVSVGYFHICGITVDGSGYCWGDNDYGQLGYGSSDLNNNLPVSIDGGRLEWKALSTGSYHTCGVTTAGIGYCWGSNLYGRLGDGSEVDSSYPVEIGSGKYQWSEISPAYFHTCGVTVEGSGYCWGLNDYGELGDGSVSDSFLPVEIDSGRNQWKSLSGGVSHTCGITQNGIGYCWGNNSYGQLGDGNEIDSSYPVAINDGQHQWSQISAGFAHTCGVTVDGSGYCWGLNQNGQLGDGSDFDSSLPVKIEGEGFEWKYLTAGGDHTCGITTDGMGYCWGSNFIGQLGIGTETDVNVPAKIENGRYQWANLSTGDSHTCGVSIDGALYCWGDWSFLTSTTRTQSLPTQMTNRPPPIETPTPQSTAVGPESLGNENAPENANGKSSNADIITGITRGGMSTIVILSAGILLQFQMDQWGQL